MQRQHLVYSIILGLLCVALVVVGVLVLRRRSIVSPMPLSPVSRTKQDTPPPARPLDSYTPEPPFREGDQVLPQDGELPGGREDSENPQP